MRKRLSLAISLSIFILLFIAPNISPVQGIPNSAAKMSSDDGECFALDVIFIIDQSNSMSVGPLRSDPTSQREKAVEAMANWLIENALDHCKSARHQVGVVSFGTESKIDLPLSEISPKSFDAAVQLQLKLEERILASQMGNTMPMDAFKLARRMFDDSALRSIGIRKQVIVMLTDGLIADGSGNNGKGYIVPTQDLADYIDNNFSFDPTLKQREICIQERVDSFGGDFDNVPYEQINECMQSYDVTDNAYLNSTYLHIVLMNFRDEGWPVEIKRIYREVAENHMGKLMDFNEKNVENRNEIPDYFRTVLAAMVGVPSGRVQCGPLAVNPFLDKATFVFYKFSADTSVKLSYTDANGNNFEISGNEANDPSGFTVLEYESYGPNERYTLINPYPGIWYIESDRCSSNGVSAFYQEVKINPGGYDLPFTTIQQYDLEPYYDISAPYYLAYEMKDETGEIVKISSNPYFNVNLIASVTDPVGSVVDYPLVWNDSENKFLATEPLQVATIGAYQVKIVGTVPYYPGNKAPVTGSLATTFTQSQELINHEDLSFSVTEVKPFRIISNQPQPGQSDNQIHETILGGWPLKIKPIDFSINLSWREQPLDLPITQLLVDPNRAVKAWIEYPDGGRTDPIILELDSNDFTKLVGTFENVDSEEQFVIHAELIGESFPEFRPDFHDIEIPYSRTDKTLLTNPTFYRLLVLILAGVAFLLFLFQLFAHYDPVGGTLIFIEGGTDVKRIELFNSKKIRKLTKNEINEFDLRKMEVTYCPYIKASMDFEEEVSRSIRVIGKTACGQDFNFELQDKASNNYCLDHTMYQVRYESTETVEKPKLKLSIYLLSLVFPVVLLIIFLLM